MKLWPILRQAARRPAKEPIPFQELLPLKLKTTVSGKGDKTSDVGCLQEMAVLFASFKKNDFNQSLSAKEIESFEKSYKLFLDKKRIKKEQEKRGILTPGARDLTHKQINQLLKNFPQ